MGHKIVRPNSRAADLHLRPRDGRGTPEHRAAVERHNTAVGERLMRRDRANYPLSMFWHRTHSIALFQRRDDAPGHGDFAGQLWDWCTQNGAYGPQPEDGPDEWPTSTPEWELGRDSGWVRYSLVVRVELAGTSEARWASASPAPPEIWAAAEGWFASLGVPLYTRPTDEQFQDGRQDRREKRAAAATARALAALSVLLEQEGDAARPGGEIYWCYSGTEGAALLCTDYGKLMERAEELYGGELEHGFLRVVDGTLVAGGTSTSSAVLSALDAVLAPIGATITGRRAVLDVAEPGSGSEQADQAFPELSEDEPDDAGSELSEDEFDEGEQATLMAQARVLTLAALDALQIACNTDSAAPVPWGFLPDRGILFLAVDGGSFSVLANRLRTLYGESGEQGLVYVDGRGLRVTGRPGPPARRALSDWLACVEAPLTFEDEAERQGSDAEDASSDELVSSDSSAGDPRFRPDWGVLEGDEDAELVDAAESWDESEEPYEHSELLSAAEPWEELEEPVEYSPLADDAGSSTEVDAPAFPDQIALPNADALAGLGREQETTWSIYGPWLLIGSAHDAEVLDQLPPLAASGTLLRADDDELCFQGVADTTEESLIADYMRQTFGVEVYFQDED